MENITEKEYQSWKQRFIRMTESEKIQNIMDVVNQEANGPTHTSSSTHESMRQCVTRYLDDKDKDPEKQVYYVMRTHSHTDKQCLFKVMSRAMLSSFDANIQMNHHQRQEKNKDHQFFIMCKDEDTREHWEKEADEL